MNIRLTIVTLLAVCTVLWAMLGSARGQLQSGDLFVSANVGGTYNPAGQSSIFEYSLTGGPPPTIFPYNFNAPRALAFDSSGNLFVETNTADDSGNVQAAILKILPDGTVGSPPFADLGSFPFNFFLTGLAVDKFGDVFVSGGDNINPGTSTTIYKVTPDGSPPTQFASLNGGVNDQLVFDSAGNLFDSDNVSKIYKFTSTGGVLSNAPTIFFADDGTLFGVPNGRYPGESPLGLAFDASGNLFVCTNDVNDTPGASVILEFPSNYDPSMGTTPIKTVATGLARPRGLAFDSSGKLYVAENVIGIAPGNAAPGDILKFTPGATGGSIAVTSQQITCNNVTGTVPARTITPGTGWSVAYFDEGAVTCDFGTKFNHGPENLAFPPNTAASTMSETVPIGTVGPSNTNMTLTFPNVQTGGTTMATPIDPTSAGTLPAGFAALGTDANDLTSAFEISTTATIDTSTTPITIAFQVPLPPGPDVSTLSVFHNEGGILVDRTTSRDETTNTITASVTSLSPFVIAKSCQIPTSITSNFNGTAIKSGNYIWFSSVLKPSGLGSDPVTIHFTQQTITSANFTFSVPDAMVTFDPKATSATTTFSNGVWVTRVPSSGLAGNTFLSGFGYQLPANLPGGIKNVSWSGTINPDTPGVSVHWNWAAAVYTNFSSGYNAVGVKPVDDNKASQYQNSDHAGTPENFKSYVTGGATGGGGSNYTGGYSGTVSAGPCP